MCRNKSAGNSGCSWYCDTSILPTCMLDLWYSYVLVGYWLRV